MGKLAGSICILTGCFMLLLRWTEHVKQRECVMREILRFLRSWEYTLKMKRMRVIDFFDTYPYAPGCLQSITDEVKEMLLAHTDPTGQTAWRNALKKYERQIGMSHEAYEIFVRAGDSFFGTNRKEATQCVDMCIRQMEEVMAEERKNYREKRKVYMPVGMLTGVMLVILLL